MVSINFYKKTHTYIHKYIHKYIHTYIHKYIHTYTHTHTYIHTYTHAIHTDSKITLDATANPRNHQNLIEQVREGVRKLEKDNWTIHFTWVKAHSDNFGNELAYRLAKNAASRREGETAYS